jgi:AAA family ATP:ADP antiporter
VSDTKPSLPPGAPPAAKQNAIAQVLGSPYLRLIALMMLLLNVVNSNNEWIMDKMVSRQGMSRGELSEFYGEYFLLQNSITFAIQLFLTARVQSRFGARVALFFEPLIGIGGGAVFVMLPILSVIYWHKIFENASDYSIQSNTKELLYLPLSTIEKYSAKNFNDTFVVRGGDALAAASIFAVTSLVIPVLGDGGIKLMVGFDILLGLLWLFVANRVGRMHKEMMVRASQQANPEARQ